MPEARYDAVADFYATAFNAIDDPAGAALLDLVGSPAGLRILDLACGHGRITRELARRGADVTGADISAALIGKARQAEREHPLGPRYVHADVSSPGWHASLDARSARSTARCPATSTRFAGTGSGSTSSASPCLRRNGPIPDPARTGSRSTSRADVSRCGCLPASSPRCAAGAAG